MKKCLVCELWWMGDGVLMTSFLQGLLADGWDVTVLGKVQSRLLLGDDYPSVRWIEFNAPWTALHNKYQLWRWPWRKIFGVLRTIRREHFAAAVSVRCDPRDHFFLWLGGVPRRIGYRSRFSWHFLNETVPAPAPTAHRVEDWWSMQRHLSPTATSLFPPRLTAAPAELERFRALFARDGRPVLALHCGARALVRRWPEAYLRELIGRLRSEFDFQLVLFPESDGYGHQLCELAEHTFTGLNLAELKAVLACATLLLGNDSGPGHVADALGVPVIALFGPANPHHFRPFDRRNLVIMRDICPYHPCSDNCRFSEPYCLTQLTPDIVWREVRGYLLEASLLPGKILADS